MVCLKEWEELLREKEGEIAKRENKATADRGVSIRVTKKAKQQGTNVRCFWNKSYKIYGVK